MWSLYADFLCIENMILMISLLPMAYFHTCKTKSKSKSKIFHLHNYMNIINRLRNCNSAGFICAIIWLLVLWQALCWGNTCPEQTTLNNGCLVILPIIGNLVTCTLMHNFLQYIPISANLKTCKSAVFISWHWKRAVMTTAQQLPAGGLKALIMTNLILKLSHSWATYTSRGGTLNRFIIT